MAKFGKLPPQTRLKLQTFVAKSLEDCENVTYNGVFFVLSEKFLVFKEKLTKRFRKPKNLCSLVEPQSEETCRPGDEMTQELTDAWNLFTRVRVTLLCI